MNRSFNYLKLIIISEVMGGLKIAEAIFDVPFQLGGAKGMELHNGPILVSGCF